MKRESLLNKGGEMMPPYYHENGIEIYNGDSLEVMKQFEDKSFDLVFTDPPYNISRKNKIFRDYRNGKKADINMDFGEWDYNFNPVPFLQESKRLLGENGSVIVWTSEQMYGEYRQWFTANMYPKQLLVWVKCLAGQTELLAKVNDRIILTSLRDLYRSSYLHKRIELLTPEGKWEELASFSKNENYSSGKIIYLRNGSRFKVTDEHIFFVNGKMKRANELKKGDVLDNSHNKIKENKDFIFGYNEGWMVGFFLAEGSYQKNNELRFSVNKAEIIFFEKLKKLTLKYNGTIRKHIYKNSMAIIINSYVLRGAIQEFVKEKGSRFKHLSNNCWNSNYEFLRGIFDGWLDGDGTYVEKEKSWQVGFTRNKKLDRDMKLIANILGYTYVSRYGFYKGFGKRYKQIRAKIRKEKSTHFNAKSEYQIKRILNTRLKSYEISLKKNHKFLLYDGTIVHNSNPLPQFRLVGYRQATELLFWALKNKNTKDNPNFRFQTQSEMTNVFYAPIVGGKERTEHPTQKPLSITEKIIEIHCKEDGLILDPFMGSGTTLVAAKELNRRAIGIELNKDYCDLAVRRVKEVPDKLFKGEL